MTGRTGLVVAAYGRRGLLEADGTRWPFVPKGRGLRVVCGDRVCFEARPGSEVALVTRIEPRSNALARLQEDSRRGEVIAANITQLVAVCAPLPAPEPLLLDRHACTAELLGCRFLLAWNKSDLGDQPASSVAELASLGYPLVVTSTRQGSGLDELAGQLAGQTSVLVGQSGVGKSSIINALFPGAGATVGELSTGAAMGTHTTTAVLMYASDSTTRLLDTPGVRDFTPALPGGRRLDQGFREMHALAAGCRFGDCRHLHEPGCAVKTALAGGRLSARRYDSYCRLLATLATAAQRPAGR